MSGVLARWNSLPREEAAREILACCGSETWAASMASKRPIHDEVSLIETSDAIWQGLGESGWLEAFRSQQSSVWSEQEQRQAASADEAMKLALKWGNREYEQKFGRIFIVCATGKSASEILEILRRRLHNDEARELQQAAEEQRQIMNIRLNKWIAG